MTGIRMAQTRGGKSCCTGCESSTNGLRNVSFPREISDENDVTNHKECPDGVVEEDSRSEDKHGESDEAIKL